MDTFIDALRRLIDARVDEILTEREQCDQTETAPEPPRRPYVEVAINQAAPHVVSLNLGEYRVTWRTTAEDYALGLAGMLRGQGIVSVEVE